MVLRARVVHYPPSSITPPATLTQCALAAPPILSAGTTGGLGIAGGAHRLGAGGASLPAARRGGGAPGSGPPPPRAPQCGRRRSAARAPLLDVSQPQTRPPCRGAAAVAAALSTPLCRSPRPAQAPLWRRALSGGALCVGGCPLLRARVAGARDPWRRQPAQCGQLRGQGRAQRLGSPAPSAATEDDSDDEDDDDDDWLGRFG